LLSASNSSHSSEPAEPLAQPPVLHLPVAHPEVEVADVAHRVLLLVGYLASLEEK
jgi:hypothetical protein